MSGERIAKSTQEQAVAAWIDFRNVLRLHELAEKLAMLLFRMKRVTFVYQAKVTLFCFCRNREYHLLESSVRAVWRSGCQRSSGWTIGQRAHRNMMKNTHG